MKILIESKQYIVGELSAAELAAQEAVDELERKIARINRETAAEKDSQIQAQKLALNARIAEIQQQEAMRKAALESKRVRLTAEARKNKKYGAYVIDFEENRGFKCRACGLVVSGSGFDEHVFDSHIPLTEQIKIAARLRAQIDKENAERVKQADKDREAEEERRFAREKKLKERGFVSNGPVTF